MINYTCSNVPGSHLFQKVHTPSMEGLQKFLGGGGLKSQN